MIDFFYVLAIFILYCSLNIISLYLIFFCGAVFQWHFLNPVLQPKLSHMVTPTPSLEISWIDSVKWKQISSFDLWKEYFFSQCMERIFLTVPNRSESNVVAKSISRWHMYNKCLKSSLLLKWYFSSYICKYLSLTITITTDSLDHNILTAIYPIIHT